MKKKSIEFSKLNQHARERWVEIEAKEKKEKRKARRKKK